jgi:ribulose bisphosphate carboxylase small subunit
MARAKTKLSKKDAKDLIPDVKEFNSLAKQLVRLLGFKVTQKEKKISIMVSRIARPDNKERHIDVISMDIGRNFLKEQRKKKKEARKPGENSGWTDDFSSKRGYII